ncbi:MAG: peptide-methionine (R)-S-oxide reductase MsrB [Pseudomonadota bacterium]|nr:peptide-methionine (R)-S-oxide reductase MsrB [Pseudomonadota bacterium]
MALKRHQCIKAIGQVGDDYEMAYRKKLSAEEYKILRQKGTEPPFSGKYLYWDQKGVYCCRACGQRLFLSAYKVPSESGWPSFSRVIKGSVEFAPDFSSFMIRHEVLCSHCQSHLGHLFLNNCGQTGVEFCINSLALSFRKK